MPILWMRKWSLREDSNVPKVTQVTETGFELGPARLQSLYCLCLTKRIIFTAETQVGLSHTECLYDSCTPRNKMSERLFRTY